MVTKTDATRVRGRVIRNVRVGDEIQMVSVRDGRGSRPVRFRVFEVWDTYIRCRRNGWYECFTIGDLVQAGYEPVWDPGFGEDPRKQGVGPNEALWVKKSKKGRYWNAD